MYGSLRAGLPWSGPNSGTLFSSFFLTSALIILLIAKAGIPANGAYGCVSFLLLASMILSVVALSTLGPVGFSGFLWLYGSKFSSS